MTQKQPFRTAYGPKLKVQATPVGESRARQSMKDECDINNIMKRYQKTGLISHLKTYQGQYGEFADINFHEAMNAVASAQSMFETVPSRIRALFNNDPGRFIEFATDPANLPELRKLGLAPPASPPLGDISSLAKPGGEAESTSEASAKPSEKPEGEQDPT
ncbi:internal scaffolding protein [Microviridae sp.]|nr:internal scaffolding protein [Microviridae sp.]